MKMDGEQQQKRIDQFMNKSEIIQRLNNLNDAIQLKLNDKLSMKDFKQSIKNTSD